MEEQIVQSAESSGTPSIIIDMPDYTPYLDSISSQLDSQYQLLEFQNEVLIYATSGIWILVAVGLMSLFFIAKGSGNNS